MDSTNHQAGLQHLALRQQEDSVVARPDSGLLRQAWLQHQAALEAYHLEGTAQVVLHQRQAGEQPK